MENTNEMKIIFDSSFQICHFLQSRIQLCAEDRDFLQKGRAEIMG